MLEKALNSILKALFRDTPIAHLLCHLTQSIWHLKIRVPGAGTWHLAHHLNLASGVSLKRALKMQVRNAYFRLLVHSSQKLCPKPDSGNFAPCILPCKKGGSLNLRKERYLSKFQHIV